MVPSDGQSAQSKSSPHQDDIVLPFHATRAGTSGRIIKLGPVVDTILQRHNYPEAVSKLLAEAVTLTGLLGTALKFDGKFILQTKTDGPVSFLVADYETPGKLRGYASYDEDKLQAITNANAAVTTNDLLGNGHLTMTIDQGAGMDRYQGIVALEDMSFEEAADTYFRQSEQLPTFVRLAVANHYTKEEKEDAGQWAWRSGGLILQNLSPEGGTTPIAEEETGEAIDPIGSDDENWTRARLLAETVEDHELLDPLLTSERLLFRLFHEEGVRVFEQKPLNVYCSCSRERVEQLLRQFSAAELQDMIVDGDIVAKCEFCKSEHRFTADSYA